MEDQIVKTEFDFGWKNRNIVPEYIRLVSQYQRGDVLDIGCATCQLYKYLKEQEWRGKYYGIDSKRYENYKYPQNVNLIIGDALEIEFPKVDTVVLYNILEHVDDPAILLKKAFNAAKENILINVPKRNEEMWKYDIVEYHQLDKTHRHCGFSKEEIYKIIDTVGGEVKTYREFGKRNAMIGIRLWNSIIPKGIIYLLGKIFSSKTFYQEIWCEIIKK